MNRTLNWRLNGIVTAVILCSGLAGAADLPQIKTKIAVNVSASDSVKSEFESFVKRELRSLKDVEIVESDQDHTLAFVVLETKTSAGLTTGYAVSHVLTHRFSREVIPLMFGKKLSKEDLNWLGQATESAVFLDDHKLLTCGPDKLRSIAEKLVAQYDSDTLEPGRQNLRKLMEIMERSKDGRVAPEASLQKTNSPAPDQRRQ
jgi:hypothetical protein